MNSDLDSLTRSYTRLSRDVGGRIEFACDSDSSDALSIAEQEKDHLDQAFFVLSFSALEKKITQLASARQAAARQRETMRSAAFGKRLESAVKVAREVLGADPEWASDATQSTIRDWYDIRSEIAHGDPPTQLFDVPPVIYLADAIATTLERVMRIAPQEANEASSS
ncbi:MAG: hypothetical protein IT537_09495 [Hyphomicrobiales bacterium]|nr:hypothetical protein [Hyphomicrobiales bacterium]